MIKSIGISIRQLVIVLTVIYLAAKLRNCNVNKAR